MGVLGSKKQLDISTPFLLGPINLTSPIVGLIFYWFCLFSVYYSVLPLQVIESNEKIPDLEIEFFENKNVIIQRLRHHFVYAKPFSVSIQVFLFSSTVALENNEFYGTNHYVFCVI